MTDCQPRMSILILEKAYLQRLQRESRDTHFISRDSVMTNKHTNVDGLSRLHVQVCDDNYEDDAEEVLYTYLVDPLPVTSAQISRETQHERVLLHVFEHVKNGRSSETPQVYKAFYNRRNELSIHCGCLICIRVIIPVKF
jgi:hypothetical protein